MLGRWKAAVISPFLYSQKIFIRCFGWFSVEKNGKVIVIRNKKLRELIALLLTSNGYFRSKRQLAADLWPDASGNRAMECMYKVLSDMKRLREVIELPVAIRREEIMLQLEPEQSDIGMFELLLSDINNRDNIREAFYLYRGGFLEKEYYEWTATLQSYYEIKYLEIAEILSRHE